MIFSNVQVLSARWHLLAVVAVALALFGCSRSDVVPDGVNFSPTAFPSIVLNQTGQGWRVFVDGVDVTGPTNLRVTTDGMTSMVEVATNVDSRIVTLPQQFRLQWALDGVIHCQAAGGCPDGMTTWTRSEVP